MSQGIARWLKVKEACRYARMSRNTLMRYVRNGDICGTKRCGFWIIDRESIDKFYSEDHAILVDMMKDVELRCQT